MSNTLDRSQLKFDRMPDIAGDPIVESGSNADGEWTRWADGTQMVWYTLTLVTTGGTIWNFPLAFNSTPIAQGTSPAGNRVVAVVPNSTTQATATRYVADSGAEATGPCALFANGRWK
jgi:hypothetical protein